VQLQAQKE